MTKSLSAALLLSTLASISFAGDFKLPEEKPICKITIPDSWKPDTYTDPVDGISAQTEDGGVYLSVECVDAKNVGDTMEIGFKWFKKNDVEIDQASLKKDDAFSVNGMTGVLFTWTGKDKDGPCMIQMAVLNVVGDKGIMVDYWASPDADKKYSSVIGKIIQSIKPVAAK